MARIRSIKPDFFSSESVASLPLSARLTFIGLWTHADDNGVCVDNLTLITAAVWPHDSAADPRVPGRTAADLAALEQAGMITRYLVDGKRYLWITHFDEHQRVSHPRKSRYPLPPSPNGQTATAAIVPDLHSGEAPVILASGSGNPPEWLRPDLGAGSREQGAGKAVVTEVEPQGGTDTLRRVSGATPEDSASGADAPAAPGTEPLCPLCSAILDPDGTCFICHGNPGLAEIHKTSAAPTKPKTAKQKAST